MLRADSKWLDLRQIGDQEECLAGRVNTADMSRLRSILAEAPDEVEIQLRLHRQQGVVRAEGYAHLTGLIECQRCLGDMPLQLAAAVHSGIAESETLITRLDPSLEPVLLEGDRLELPVWIEDEILLSLPISPMCAIWTGGVCPVSGLEPVLPAPE